MVKYFEEEPNNSSKVKGLKQLLDDSTEGLKNVKDTQVDCILQSCTRKLPTIDQRLEKLEETMSDVLQIEQTKERERKTKMDHFIAEQNESFCKYLQELDERLKHIDNVYERARKEVQSKYDGMRE